MLPVLILPIKSLFVLMRYCSGIGASADALAFVKYSLVWLLPTVLLVMAISLLVTALLENYTAILLTGVIWLAGRPSVDKIADGNYDLFDLIIRHNTLKGYGRMMFPAIILLLVIPFVYGTSNLDSLKSADCLERMTALIGLPMFVPLLKPEQEAGMDAIITLRPFSCRGTVGLRMILSLLCTFILILLFEGYMRIDGCILLIFCYAFRTLAAAMTLGFMGLLASAVSKNTIVGFLVSFAGTLSCR